MSISWSEWNIRLGFSATKNPAVLPVECSRISGIANSPQLLSLEKAGLCQRTSDSIRILYVKTVHDVLLSMRWAGSSFRSAGGISFGSSLVAFLNSEIPLPMPLAISGIRLAPNKRRMIRNMIINSVGLIPNKEFTPFGSLDETHYVKFNL